MHFILPRLSVLSRETIISAVCRKKNLTKVTFSLLYNDTVQIAKFNSIAAGHIYVGLNYHGIKMGYEDASHTRERKQATIFTVSGMDICSIHFSMHFIA